jgi:WD40 repeat protein
MENLVENLVGKTVKGYALHELIGEGGFGAVYRATQTVVDREVAIKVILPQYANRPEFIRRFESEAKLIARLEHLYIVPLIDYWRDPDGAFLVLRWLRGGTLKDLLREQGAMQPRAAAKLFTQVASALHIAHRNNVVHRDVKPANILLDEEGNGYLSDFGIALDTVESTGATTSGGGITGSAGYISPEQVNVSPVTNRADIYSMTLVLYEMLAGIHPYPDAKSAIALFIKHTNEELPYLEQFPESLNAVLQKGAAKDPNERYADIMEMVQDLKQALGEVEGVVIGPGMGAVWDDWDTTSMQPALQVGEVYNPYKGLRAFQEGDAGDFFGRDALIQQLLWRMVEAHEYQRFLAVIGPSGSGKSSVVKAGLIPSLRAGAIQGSENWFIVEMLPGADPIVELEEAIISVSVNQIAQIVMRLRSNPRALHDIVWDILPKDDSELVLVIDQFEEVFTQATDNDRNAFLENLYEAIIAEDSRLRVIVTMRADFYDRPLMVPKFSALMQQRTEVVVPMNAEELTQSITGPSRRLNVVFQQGLVPQIVAEVSQQPGVLPMLQYTLTELFERREGQIMTVSAYNELGGVLGSLAKRAEEIYLKMNDVQQETTRQLFLRLVTLGEGSEDTRRRALMGEVLSASRDSKVMQQIVDTFGNYRLLTFDRDPTTRTPTVEIAHEALIREWQRLKTWLSEGRSDVRLQRQLAARAQEWENAKRDKGSLLRGGQLVQFSEWAASTTLILAKLDQDFLDASLEERKREEAEEAARLERERLQERRARRLQRVIIGVMGLALVAGVIASIFIIQASIEARNQGNIANTQVVVAREALSTATIAQGDALNSADEAGTQAARAALNADAAGTAQAEALAQATIAVAAQKTSDYNADQAETQAVAVGIQATIAAQNAAAAETAQQEALIRSTAAIAAQGTAVSLAETAVFAEEEARVEAERARSLALAASASGLASSNAPLALRLAIEANNVSEPVPQAERILIALIYDAPRRRYNSRHGAINSLIVTGDSQRAISGNADGSITFWNIPNGGLVRVLYGHKGAVNTVAINADNTILASGDENGIVRLWDLATGQPLFVFDEHNGSPINTITFSPAGSRVASGADDGRILVWNIRSGIIGEEIPGTNSPVNHLTFNPEDPNLLFIAADDGLRTWDFNGDGYILFDGDVRRVKSGAYRPDGSLLVTSDIAGSGVPLLWRLGELELDDNNTVPQYQLFQEQPAHNGPVNSVAFSPNGSLVLSASDDFGVFLSDVRNGIIIKQFNGHTSRVNAAAFTPDGASVVSASSDGVMYLWDVAPSASNVEDFTLLTDSISNVLLLPNTDILYATDFGRVVVIAPPAEIAENTPTPVVVPTNSDNVIALTPIVDVDLGRSDIPQSALALSPRSTEDRVIIARGSTDLGIYDLTNNQLLQRFTIDFPEIQDDLVWVDDVAFSPDGQFVVWGGGYFFRQGTASFTRVGILRLFDVETGAQVRDFDLRAALSSLDQIVAATPTLTPTPAEAEAPPTANTAAVLQGVNDAVTAVAISPDGVLIASGIEDGRILLWDIITGSKLAELPGHSDAVTDLQFGIIRNEVSGVGELILLSAAKDRVIILWQINIQNGQISGQLLRRFVGHSGAVNSIAFDGRDLLSASEDGTLRLWDGLTGDLIQRFGEQDSPITSVVFTRNDAALIGTLNGEVKTISIETAANLELWARRNRYIPDLNCAQRQQFNIPPLCEGELAPLPPDAPPFGAPPPLPGSAAVATPSLTPVSTPPAPAATEESTGST